MTEGLEEGVPNTQELFGLLCYGTWNIGDEIQSLAARQFLPNVDVLVDRDALGGHRFDERTRLIMNGWWLHGEDWPPSDHNLRPLLTSMFFDHRHPVVRDAVLSPSGRAFLEENGPVGARDLDTLAFLEGEGIPSYFSGCLTLTLQRDPFIRTQDFVVAVDLPDNLLDVLRKRCGREVVSLSSYHEPSLSTDLRFRLAELYLLLFQSASYVVTTRLHGLLPALAFDTPSLLVMAPGTFDERRFSGLSDLAHTCSAEQFLDDAALSVGPPRGPKGLHLELRERLIESCRRFTGSGPAIFEASTLLRSEGSVEWVGKLVGDQVAKARYGRWYIDENPVRRHPVGALMGRATRRLRSAMVRSSS